MQGLSASTRAPRCQPALPSVLLRLSLLLAALLLVLLPRPTPAASAATSASEGAAAHRGPLTFEQDIRPILKANCFDCHGEQDKPKGGLDLRLQRTMVSGGESGPAIVPGRPAQSRLLDLIRRGEMPKREKKLTAAEIARIENWIASGARTARPEPASLPRGMTITEEERRHWAFQPIRRPALPGAGTRRSERDRVRTPVDAFLLAALKPKGLAFSPDAGKVALLRRAWFDLVGLPPTREATQRFLSDAAPDAYERMVDELLGSPHYGERWGRHWLDAAGYADSDGATADDSPRAYAYKYRDYVIRAFNADKPFNRFIEEQLAGDELAGARGSEAGAALASPAAMEQLIATGFLRMGPDATGGGGGDGDLARNQVMADTLKIVSTSLLGLTVGCAQCHDHRYDPIPQVDYYRLRAVFEPAYDWKHWRNPGQRVISLYTESDRTRAAAVEAEAGKLAAERSAREKVHLAAALEKELLKFEDPLRGKLREAFQTAATKRTPAQNALLKENPSVNIDGGVLYQYDTKAADELKAMDARIGETRARRPAEDFISVLTEVPGQLPVTHRFHRGDPQQPQEAIAPGGLSVLGADGRAVEFPVQDSARPTSGRRLAFARWLVGPENPLTARVLVNRVWMHHFGRGLVRTPADFGAMGERPSHPELLDWLADEFVAGGWSLKQLHRLILTSTVYRQESSRGASSRAAECQRADPENMLYWHKPVQRLDAEIVRDATLAVSGALNEKMYGSPVPVRPDAAGQIVVGIDKTEGDNKMPVEVPLLGEEHRRSLYVQVRRSRPLALLTTFDAPVMELNCERRQASTSPMQSLMLMNSQFILDQSARFADRVVREAPNSEMRQRIRTAWSMAFSRPPTPWEESGALEFLATQLPVLEERAAAVEAKERTSEKENGKGKKSATVAAVVPETQALRNLCQALLGSNEFLYVD